MIHVVDAGLMPYRAAWDLQLSLHQQVLSGQFPDGALILVEHPPVITVGRRANAQQHLLAPPQLLQARGIDLVETDRGGDITFHGPGQLVLYPILPLNRYHLNLHGYLRLLEQIAIDTLAAFNIHALRDPLPNPATGVWVIIAPASENRPPAYAKIAAIGIKVKRWITLHGLALNVTTDLSFFQTINACGLSREVTSMAKILKDNALQMPPVKAQMLAACRHHFGP